MAEIAGAHIGEMLWRERVAAPAGTVGGFQWTQPELAEKLTRARIEEAKSAGAAGIVTEDPQCTAQLAKYAEGLPVANLVELVAGKI
jgi:Fe-S oxidoreductase